MILVGRQADALCEVLSQHVGHDIEIGLYGTKDEHGHVTEVWDAAVECVTCGEVIIDGDRSIPVEGEDD